MTHITMKYVIFSMCPVKTVCALGNVNASKVDVTLWNRHGHAIKAGKGIIHKNNNTGTRNAKAWKWFVTICAPLSPFLAFLSACILGPDSQREIQFLLTAACCPDRIYHLELELKPDRQCTVHTFWTAPVTTLTNTHIQYSETWRHAH